MADPRCFEGNLNVEDYYPFGMLMVGRNWSVTNENYKFGFNGKEDDAEVYGDGNLYDYGFRIYNPLLGRFLSVDPLSNSFCWVTPYQFAFNRPIVAIDLDGLEGVDENCGVEGDGVGTDPNEEGCNYNTFTPTSTYKGDIQPVDVAEYNGTMPSGNSVATESFTAGNYEILPNYSIDNNGCKTLSFYTASIEITDLSGSRGTFDVPRIDWVIPANQIDYFIENVDQYASVADGLYGGGYHMRESTIQGYNGDVLQGYKTLFIGEWSNPVNWMYVASGVAISRMGYVSRGAGIVSTSAAESEGLCGLNYAVTPAKHMQNPGRYVPMMLQEDIINTVKPMLDPRGSSAMMYYTTIYREGKMYNFELLYDSKTNTVWHFEYSRRAMGPLPAIK